MNLKTLNAIHNYDIIGHDQPFENLKEAQSQSPVSKIAAIANNQLKKNYWIKPELIAKKLNFEKCYSSIKSNIQHSMNSFQIQEKET